ncbi:TIGR02281 family clan AA aspartic protease [Sphingomonas sp. 2R-10]|uniref:retropepsin-like aspartic protease family protein n=1 Tax=Sphingomonas sp. 2R-10 TaxID=3045148 RepID=UPI000F7A446D|nr:TIGR02281 family clan AA aspartic protease [Sphingomonas sp. 2R-10]MDJ0277161.1 TIGR02281 family clan AA aspartic protease [Sphingomonas sp. 2R-10]
MSDDRGIYVLMGLMMLILPLSSLLARKPRTSVVLRAVLGWGVIVAILYLAFANRARLGELAGSVGDKIGRSEQRVEGDTVRIRQSLDGHFWAQVRLNGVERRMLIDSGATSTAISEATAKAIGVTPRRVPPVILSTGNGRVEAARGRIETVRIGDLETRDLPVVIAPTFGDLDVIGMNFLSRLQGWRVERGTLVLQRDIVD